MTDEQFDELMRDAARTYRRPPDPPLDGMWLQVERSLEGGAEVHPMPARRRPPARVAGWLRVAAVLLVGIAIGRASTLSRAGTEVGVAGVAPPERELALTDVATEQYLDQAAELLMVLPVELRQARADSTFALHVADMLLQTRRMLDSPDLADPGLHTLLEDLEYVLVQVVRLQADRDPMKVDLLEESLEQRNVLPRLYNAVAFHSMD